MAKEFLLLMRGLLAIALLLVAPGCSHSIAPRVATGPALKVLSYNINWGGPAPDVAARIIAGSGADVVCLQETTPEWETYLRSELRSAYPFAEFRYSSSRMGGGLGFLSRARAQEINYVQSETGWFDSWIMGFESKIGKVQVLNVHLRPPVSDSGGVVSGYLFTRQDRLQEIQKAYSRRDPALRMIVAGDFNDGEDSRAVTWLTSQGLTNALPLFDRSSPTWEWRTSVATLHRRMDHILFSPALSCCSCRVMRAGSSDHFPVEAIFEAAARFREQRNDQF